MSDQKTKALESFSNLYDLLRAHGVGASGIRTRIFNLLQFPKVRISDDHRESCLAHARLLTEAELLKVNETLLEMLESFIVNNDKLVQVYDLSAKDLNKIEDKIRALISSKTIGIALTFPWLPDDTKQVPEKLHPIKILNLEAGNKAVLIGSRRDYYKVFRLSEDDLKDGVLSGVEQVQQVSAKGLVSDLSVDVIVLDYEKERLELRLSRACKLSGSYQDKFAKRLVSFVQGCLGGGVPNAYNFLPLIKGMYSSADDTGMVTRLDFLTEEGIERTEKSSRDKKDIRSETYHKGGAKEIKYTFQGYGIRKIWALPLSGRDTYKLAVDISGTANLLRKGNQPIDKLKLLDCYTMSDYNYLFYKVVPS